MCWVEFFRKKIFEKEQHLLACSLGGGYPGGGNLEFFKFSFLLFIAFLVNSNLEFFKFSFLLFIAFLVNSNFEFFKFRTLENLCKKA